MEEEDDLTDDETLLLVAKARAAMGDQIEVATDNGVAKGNCSDVASGQDHDERGRQLNDAHELQRPGAYSKSPGDGFKRNRTFQRTSYSKRNVMMDTVGSTSCDDRFQRTNDVEEDEEYDRKPAANQLSQ